MCVAGIGEKQAPSRLGQPIGRLVWRLWQVKPEDLGQIGKMEGNWSKPTLISRLCIDLPNPHLPWPTASGWPHPAGSTISEGVFQPSLSPPRVQQIETVTEPRLL